MIYIQKKRVDNGTRFYTYIREREIYYLLASNSFLKAV